MSKGCRSRVKNKKQYDDNFDKIKKSDQPSPVKKTKTLVIPLMGRATRYYY